MIARVVVGRDRERNTCDLMRQGGRKSVVAESSMASVDTDAIARHAHFAAWVEMPIVQSGRRALFHHGPHSHLRLRCTPGNRWYGGLGLVQSRQIARVAPIQRSTRTLTPGLGVDQSRWCGAKHWPAPGHGRWEMEMAMMQIRISLATQPTCCTRPHPVHVRVHACTVA